MSAPQTLRPWLRQLLPPLGPCAQAATTALLRTLLVGFTTELSQLARQLDRGTRAKGGRQFLARWLDRPHWEPEQIYAQLGRRTRRLLARRGTVPLLVDFTHLQDQWSVLQVSFPWQGRALPLYRAVVSYAAPEVGHRELVRAACTFLSAQLPGPRSRYVLVMDRGFPSHLLVRELTKTGWRFVLRVASEWKLTHRDYTGQLKHARAQPELAGPTPRLFAAAVLGQRGRGRTEWSEANVVTYHGEGHQDAWFLVTSERQAGLAVSIYRRRMQIEGEFRDLKGAFGLDRLARWQDRERLARFLALIAVYEWYLAHLWEGQQIHQWQAFFAVHGRLSWIRLTREWLQQQFRLAANPVLASL
jgi:Transposase DDE domain